MTNLYFGRYIDPDARAAAGDSSITNNSLGYSTIPTTNVVMSEALVSKYALGLYSAASNVGARKQKRKLTYIANILVVSDAKRPQNEGKVFLFKFGLS